MTTLLVRGIGELCTCDPRHDDAPGVIRGAAIVAEHGVLTFVGEESRLPRDALAGDADEIDVHGAAVIPGFVDSHTHTVWLGDRGHEYDARASGVSYEAIAEAGGGIRATVKATAEAGVNQLAAAALPRVQTMLRHGTTTAEVKSGYGLSVDAEMRQLDAARGLAGRGDVPDILTTYLPLHAPPDGDRNAFLDEVCNRGLSEASSRANFVDAFCEHGAYAVEECERFFSAARARGLRVKVHAEQLSRSGGALLAARCSAVSADHLEHAVASDFSALARAGVVATFLPGAALSMGGARIPGATAIAEGCTIAIASDCNPGTSYTESMPLMCSLAVSLAQLTPAQALVAATAGGAAALGLDDRGVLRPGARCDLVVLATPHWVDVAYHLGGDVVSQVVRLGRLVHGVG